MTTWQDRVNRSVLTVLGLVLVLAGAYGLARGYSVFGTRAADEAVLSVASRDFVDRNGQWFWPLAVACLVLLSVLALRWLLAQLRSPQVAEFQLSEGPGTPGVTHVKLGAAARAFAADIETYPGVLRAWARIVGDKDRLELNVRADVDAESDVTLVRKQIEDEALPRLGQALERDVVARQVTLFLT